MSPNIKYIVVVAFLLLIPFASGYYADIYVEVDEVGKTSISGISNSNILTEQSHLFTSKTKDVWTLQINDSLFYDTLTYEIHLPPNAQVLFLESSTTAAISVEDKHPLISGFGNNDSLRVIVQYRFVEEESSQLPFIVLIIIVCLVITSAIYVYIKHKPSKISSQLSGRQQKIVAMIEKHGPMTAKKINEELKLPKSSLSRNVNSLVQRGILQVEDQGLSKKLSLAKKEV